MSWAVASRPVDIGVPNEWRIHPNTRGFIRMSAAPVHFSADAPARSGAVLVALWLAFRGGAQRGRTRCWGLNFQQEQVVKASPGAHLVVAGAGTGKTKVLTERLVHLLKEGVEPSRVVLLTFTRKAAEEMKFRAESLMGHGIGRGLRSGTFHGFCLDLLSRYTTRLGFLEGLTVLDVDDATDMVQQIRQGLGLAGKKKAFPSAGELFRLFSLSVNSGTPLTELSLRGKYYDHLDGIGAVWEAFEEAKQRQNCMDFNDLLLRCDKLLREDEQVRLVEAGACEHLLVDEYQDTNPLQASLVQQLSSVHGNVVAVGDDAQSIYGFRGASVENMWQFVDTFASGEPLFLEDNYRSTQPILDLANAVLSGSTIHYSS